MAEFKKIYLSERLNIFEIPQSEDFYSTAGRPPDSGVDLIEWIVEAQSLGLIPTGTGTFIPLTTDVISTATGGTTIIQPGVVTNTKLATMPTGSIKGRKTAGTGIVEDLSAADAKTVLSLDNVDNTSDANKPISTAAQTAINAKQDTLISGTNIKTINGVTLLGAGNISITAGGGVTSVFTRTGAITSAAGDYTATQITNTPAGNIAAVTVQSAINELDTEKQVNIQFQDETTNLGASGTVDTINFAGTGVVATRVGNTVTATIAGNTTDNFYQATVTAQNTITTLSPVPLDSTKVQFSVNGLIERNGVSIAAGVVTITPATLGYNIETTDLVMVQYLSA